MGFLYNGVSYLITSVVYFLQLPTSVDDLWSIQELSTFEICTSLVYYSTLFVIMYYAYRNFFCPLRIIKPHGSTGFIRKGNQSLEEVVQETLENKDIGQIPPVFPNGWFQVITSSELKKGEVKRLNVLGQNLSLYRTEGKGEVRVVETYCPHLGADLSAGGKVVGDCIECPFHGWKFDGKSGQLVDIPYSNTDKMKFVKLGTRHCIEKWGAIYVWHHADDTNPTFELPEIEEFYSYKWGGCSDHKVDCHIEDIPENAADAAHLAFLHKPALSTDVGGSSKFDEVIQHDILVSWQANTEKGKEHLANCSISDAPYLDIFGKKLYVPSFNFKILQIGPGVVHIKAYRPGFECIIIQTVTPLKPLRQRLHQDFFFKKGTFNLFQRLFIKLLTIQIERDIVVWTNKTYPAQPKFPKEERCIASHRRWYKQFFSPNSLRLSKAGHLINYDPKSKKNTFESLDF